MELAFPASLDGADFWIGDSNRQAADYIRRWPDWPTRSLILYGRPGSGKTHLSTLWQQKADALDWSLDRSAIWREVRTERRGPFALRIEDVDQLLAQMPAAERDLLHSFNWVMEQGGWILFTARGTVKDWSIRLKDLSSRLLALPAVPIGLPDDSLLQAVAAKLFQDRGLAVSRDHLNFLIRHGERSFEYIAAIVAGLDRATLAEKKPVSLLMLQRIINELREQQQNGQNSVFKATDR